MRSGLAKTQSVLNMRTSARRTGLCWEATRAPRWTRIPQAWAAWAAQAGLLRARPQSEKSQGVWGAAPPKSNPLKTDSETTKTDGKKSLSFLAHAAFHAEPVHSHYGLAFQPKPPWYLAVQDDLRAFLMRPRNWTVQVSGTPGTPVVVGYEVDRSRTGLLRGVVPTNFTVRVRRRLYLAVKNVGTTNADLGAGCGGVGYGETCLPPLYGCWIQVDQAAAGGANYDRVTLFPNDWPETLPPGMTESEAKTHDFARELHEARLRAFQAAVAKDPEDQPALLGLAKEAHALKNAAAAEAAYQALLASGPPHRVSLNEKAWWYAEDGGTNLDRAYELALKAQAEDPRSEEIVDTVGWVLFKRGDYEQALRVMRSISKSYVDGVPDIQNS